MKLTLTMIVKDGLENLKRLYPLIKDHVDEWVVVVPPKDKAIKFLTGKATVIEKDFTQPIEPKIIKQMKEWGLDVNPDYRLFNFADARNASLKHATGDFVLWLDADDTPLGIDNVKKFIENNPDVEVFNAVYDYAKDEEGNSISDHTRERVVLNNGKWRWRGAKLGLIHETLMPIEPFNPMVLDFPDEVFRVEHNSDHMDESSLRNHVALLYEYLKTDGEDARTTYYLGIEFFNRKMYDFSIKILLEFMENSGSDEDKHSAWLKIAEAYHMMGDAPSGRNAYLRAIDELPHKPDGYLGLGESYHEEGKWAKSTEYLMTGLQKKMPTGKHGLDRTRYTFRPSGYVALNYLQMGKPGDAYEWFIRTAKMNPKHPWVKDYAPLFADAKNLDEYVRSFVKLGQLSQKLYPKTLSKLAEVVPDELMDQELLMDFKWRYAKPKIWSDKSVVFFCSHAFEDWGPESLEKGCGGSEEAVIQLSKRLVKLGWEVTVYNNCIREGKFDGVDWVRFERFNPRDIFNVLISWRNNTFRDQKVANKKFIDLHDVPDINYYKDDDLTEVKLLVKSQYHRSLLPNVSDDKFTIIPNGIDTKQFETPKKTKNNMVYTSSYDRGLEHLLNMWADVKKEVPDATLDCYYGFNLFDTTPLGKMPQGRAWKAKMLKLLNQDGVTDHGRVGTDEVAEAYKKADVWAYPTDFPEIDCITATKAMAAKCVPITTDYAVMKERNQGIMIEGDINRPEPFNKFKTELTALLKDDKRKEEIRAKLDVASYDWDVVASRWSDLFKEE